MTSLFLISFEVEAKPDDNVEAPEIEGKLKLHRVVPDVMKVGSTK